MKRAAFGLRLLAFGAMLLAVSPARASVFYPETYTLANGLQIVIVKGALSPAVTHMVWYKVGSADDPAGRSGLAHYLEHMMFKETEMYPAGFYSAHIAGQGGEDNAFTSHDYTAYYVSIAADRLPLVMQLEAERMRGLRLSPQEAEPELAVVLSERQQRTDNDPQGLFEEKIRAALFPDHPYGRPVIGWKAELEAIKPSDAQAFYKAHYAPNQAVVVVSGDVETQEVLRLADATYGRLPQTKVSREPLPPLQKPKETRLEMKDPRVKQPYVTWRIIAPSARTEGRAALALEVLAEALTGGEVGLLYRHFVVEKQTASGLDASYDPASRGAAVFAFVATPSPGQNVRALEKEMNVYLKQLARVGLSSRLVQEAKQRLQDSAVFARDRLMAPASILGEALAIGQNVEDIEAWPERVSRVSTAEVNAALRALLSSPQVIGILEPAAKEGAAP